MKGYRKEPDYIAELSEFEKFRYKKFSKIFVEKYRRNKDEASDYLEEINLKEEEYRYFRYYNQLAIGKPV